VPEQGVSNYLLPSSNNAFSGVLVASKRTSYSENQGLDEKDAASDEEGDDD